MSKISKPIDTLSLILTITGMIKSGTIILATVLLQWARAKQKLAENKQALAEVDLKINEEHNEIDKEYDNQSPDTIIRDFLDNEPTGNE